MIANITRAGHLRSRSPPTSRSSPACSRRPRPHTTPCDVRCSERQCRRRRRNAMVTQPSTREQVGVHYSQANEPPRAPTRKISAPGRHRGTGQRPQCGPGFSITLSMSASATQFRCHAGGRHHAADQRVDDQQRIDCAASANNMAGIAVTNNSSITRGLVKVPDMPETLERSDSGAAPAVSASRMLTQITPSGSVSHAGFYYRRW